MAPALAATGRRREPPPIFGPRQICRTDPAPSGPRRPTLGCMNTIHLSDSELEMARHALEAYLRAFGHDEADTVREIKRVILKLSAALPEGEEPRFIA